MAARDRDYRASQTYVDGNTVRRLEAAPDTRRRQELERRQEAERRKQEEERRRQEIQRRNKHAARRNREKAMQMSRGYVAFLSVAAIVTALVSAAYVQLQSDVTSRLKSISGLESQVADLKADNDATLKRINTAVDLTTVKDVAMNQLGMVYAGKDQIVYYSVDDDDYMNQYSEIPEQ